MRKIYFFAPVIFLLSCHTRPTLPNPHALERERICVEYLQNQDYERAKINCELCLQFDDKTPECLNGLGIVAKKEGYDSQAISWFSKAAQQDPQLAQARNNLGSIYFDQQNYQKSLPFFKAALQIDPGFIDARYNYGLAYMRIAYQKMTTNIADAKKNFALASVQYEMLSELDPKNTNAYRNLGLIKNYLASLEKEDSAQQNNLQQAKKYFEQCLSIDDQNELCLESYAHTLFSLGQYNLAVQNFMKCLSVNKNNLNCINGVKPAQSENNLQKSTLVDLQNAVNKNTGNAAARYAYCKSLFEHGMVKEAVAQCELAVSINSKFCAAQYTLAMHYKNLFVASKASLHCRAFLACDEGRKEQEQRENCTEVLIALQ